MYIIIEFEGLPFITPRLALVFLDLCGGVECMCMVWL